MFNPDVLIGDVFSEADIHRIFGCQLQKGIRLSKKNRAIVIVSDATPKNMYADVWKDGILYYTGTNAGMKDGNQTLVGPGNNNGALKAVWDEPDSTTIFLFEKYAANQCTYKGIVRLAQEPYQEPRQANPSQLVWKFPLRLEEIGIERLQKDYERIENKALQKTEVELKRSVDRRLKNPNKAAPVKRASSATVYDRDSEISAYIKVRAHGICDFCGEKAPFMDANKRPYLESHHIRWLARGGDDEPINMVALCPNCHRRMHILDLEEDRAALRAIAEKYYLCGK